MQTSHGCDRPASADRDPSVTGPHAGFDRYGRFGHLYYRCERCGLESTDAAITRGCPDCHDDRGCPDCHDDRGCPDGRYGRTYRCTVDSPARVGRRR